MKNFFNLPFLVLSAVLLISFGIRTYNLNYNSPFLDEAIYVMLGKKIFMGTILNDGPFSWVGGMPFFYPFFSAVFYNFGEIVGARFFNVILGTFSTYLIFLFVSKLKIFKEDLSNFYSGVIAAAFFAIAPVPHWLSRLAIYDMLSYTLFLSGVVVLQIALKKNRSVLYLLAGISLFLSFLAKYTVVLFFPIIVFLFMLQGYKLLKTHGKNIFLFLITLFILMAFYVGFYYLDLKDFLTSNIVGNGESVTQNIISEFIFYTKTWYLLAIPGMIFVIFKKKYYLLLFVLASCLPLVANIVTQNDSTVHQNSIFSLTFLLPLCAAIFVSIISKAKIAGIVFLSITLAYIFYQSLPVKYELEHFWQNLSRTTSYLKEEVGPNDVILAESGDVAFLATYNTVPAENLHGPYVFGYEDLEGDEAYAKALQDSYFTILQLDESALEITPEMQSAIEQNYTEVFSDEQSIIYRVNGGE